MAKGASGKGAAALGESSPMLPLPVMGCGHWKPTTVLFGEPAIGGSAVGTVCGELEILLGVVAEN